MFVLHEYVQIWSLLSVRQIKKICPSKQTKHSYSFNQNISRNEQYKDMFTGEQ